MKYLKERIFKALHEKNAIQSFLCRKWLFDLSQRFGFHLMGDHFYEVIPNTRELATHYVDQPRELAGIAWDFPQYEQEALGLLEGYGPEYLQEVFRFGFEEENVYFRGFDALMLYLLIRDRKPHKIVELGQGSSTRVIFSALRKVAEETGEAHEFVSVDPFPRLKSQEYPASVKVTVLQNRVQDIDPESLMEGCDFLFVDSSHAYRCQSDLEFIFLHLLDRLPVKSLLHLHDIFSPYEYPLYWFTHQKRFWNEQYILENFLRYNTDFVPFLPVYWLARDSACLRQQVAQVSLPKDFAAAGGSFYCERRARRGA